MEYIAKDNTADELKKKRKQEKIKKERERLLSKLATGKLTDTRSKVAFILNLYPNTRNSDILLAHKYWETFQNEEYGDGKVDIAKSFKLERNSSITRARAKIQNEFGLFQASEEVKGFRGGKAARMKEEQLADKPGIPSITFFIDESGKNQEYLVVGGICGVDSHRVFSLTRHLIEWKDNKINFEFHFAELSKTKLQNYKDFFHEAIGFLDTIGFKAIVIRLPGLKRSIEEVVTELTYQFIYQSIEHECQTGRITLPRIAHVFKDKDDAADSIFMTKLEQNLKTCFRDDFQENLIPLQ